MSPLPSPVGFPVELRPSTERPEPAYRLRDDLVALRGAVPEALRQRVVREHPGEDIVVVRAALEDLDDASLERALLPVYTSADGVEFGVVTGELFVRFAEGVVAERRSADLEAAGYEISRVLSYAPHAVWVRAPSSRAGDSLGGISRLEELPEVSNVEPQFLLPSVRR